MRSTTSWLWHAITPGTQAFLAARRFLVMGVLAVAFSLAPAAPACADAPPLTELTQAQSQLSALEGKADARTKAALEGTVAQLGIATAQSLWADSSDAVPPPYGDTVFSASNTAIDDLTGAFGDPTISREALRTADAEILDAAHELADGALAQLGGARWGWQGLRRGSIHDFQALWDGAFRILGEEITRAATTVPQATVDQAALNYLPHYDSLGALPESISGSPLLSAGRPELYYYGSEGCPFCAVDRWSMVVGLAQFGEFSPLALMESSTYDVYPATNTFTFYGSHYYSPYLAFVPDEAFTNQPGGTETCDGVTYPTWTSLQSPADEQQQLIDQYDYFYEGCGSFPFLDLANMFATAGSYASPSVVGGMSWRQIAASLEQPSSMAGQEIDAGAEILAAQVCQVDGEQPARVCEDPVNRQYQHALTTQSTHIDGRNAIYDVSCPSTSLCVAVDAAGNVLVSDDPSSATPSWSAPSDIDGANSLDDVSCPSTSLCVAVDAAGNVLVSDDPSSPTPTWSAPSDIDGTNAFTFVSCPSASLCVAVDDAGRALISDDPSASTPTWSAPSDIDGANSLTVSCPSTSLCEVGDTAGNVLVSRDPSAATPTWSAPANIDGTNAIYDVSCPSASLCVAVDGDGEALVSQDPSAAAPTWSAPEQIDNSAIYHVTCPSSSLCVAVDGDGKALISGDPTATTPTWSASASTGG
jgi:hypothetical protein